MKHSLFTRILSMCLALMLCMTASVSAFAQEDYLLDEGFSVNPVSGKPEEKNNEQEKDEKDTDPAPEPCNPWEHLPDENGICTLCGMNLIQTFTDMVEQMNLEEYNAVWNAVGWAEQQGEEPDEETQEHFDVLYQAVLDAQDIYSCMSQIEDEQVEAAVSKLFAIMQSVQYHYDNPVNPKEDDKGAEKTEPDDQLEEILNKLYDGNSYLPDKPTGYYISETTGLPVLTGEVKTSISMLTENNVGGMDNARVTGYKTSNYSCKIR